MSPLISATPYKNKSIVAIVHRPTGRTGPYDAVSRCVGEHGHQHYGHTPV